MQVNPYLSFKGDCEAAFNWYVQCLGAQLGPMFRYGGSPMEHDVPADWADKIMHGRITINGQVLMGADIAPERYEAPKGFSMSIHISNAADAERIFNALSAGGTMTMPLEKTFWAERFGMLVDRFGITWVVNCEAAEAATA